MKQRLTGYENPLLRQSMKMKALSFAYSRFTSHLSSNINGLNTKEIEIIIL